MLKPLFSWPFGKKYRGAKNGRKNEKALFLNGLDITYVNNGAVPVP